MLSDTQLPVHEYDALRNGAALQVRPAAGVLVLTDADRADFLQRMTTNDIAALRPGMACVTVLTSPTARIVQVFTVVAPANEPDALWLLPAPGATDALERNLRGQIFFMDKVRVANRSSSLARLRIMGPQTAAVLAAIGFDLSAAADDTAHAHDGLLAVIQHKYDLPGIELVVPTERLAAIVAALRQAGAVMLDDDYAYHAHRVELGRPAPDAELTGEYNPLEAGLDWACAENKGCYTGQEIIARQRTYDKVTRTLIGLRSAAPLPAGAQLTADGRAVGVVTSSAWSPALTTHLALAIVKRPHNTAGTELLADTIAATVHELPIVQFGN